MLLRKDGLDVIAIPQPSHAWLSGQLARAWGNQSFAAPVPREELCLAAELHDIGWLSWEEAPLLDAGTGLPQEFFKVPPKSHIALWREGVRRAGTFGHYCALLVSLHADTIYGRYFDFGKARPEDAEAVRAFLDEQHRFQARAAAALRASPEIGEQASPVAVERNRLLIAALDWISLDICWGVTTEKTIPDVPVAGDQRTGLACGRAAVAMISSSMISFSTLGLSGRRALRFAPRANVCASAFRRRMICGARSTKPSRCLSPRGCTKLDAAASDYSELLPSPRQKMLNTHAVTLPKPGHAWRPLSCCCRTFR